jgi:hypothetical protein
MQAAQDLCVLFVFFVLPPPKKCRFEIVFNKTGYKGFVCMSSLLLDLKSSTAAGGGFNKLLVAVERWMHRSSLKRKIRRNVDQSPNTNTSS